MSERGGGFWRVPWSPSVGFLAFHGVIVFMVVSFLRIGNGFSAILMFKFEELAKPVVVSRNGSGQIEACPEPKNEEPDKDELKLGGDPL